MSQWMQWNNCATLTFVFWCHQLILFWFDAYIYIYIIFFNWLNTLICLMLYSVSLIRILSIFCFSLHGARRYITFDQSLFSGKVFIVRFLIYTIFHIIFSDFPPNFLSVLCNLYYLRLSFCFKLLATLQIIKYLTKIM